MIRGALPAAAFAALAMSCTRAPPAPTADAGERHRDVVAVEDVPVDAGSSPSADVPRARRVMVSACGDIPVAPSVLAEAARHADEGRLRWILAPIAPLLGGRAIAFANLRGALSATPGTATHDRFVGPLELARAVRQTGFDVVQLANDRALDAASAGLAETMHAFGAAHAEVTGACETEGLCAPAVIERDGVRVGFLSATTRSGHSATDHPGDAHLVPLLGDGAAVVASVREARARVDVLVFGLHVGRDGVPAAGSSRRALVDRLVEAGADLVLVTGPERVARVERHPSPRGDAVVAWSLGSLVSGLGAGWHPGVTAASVAANPWTYDPALRDAMVLHVTFDATDANHLAIAGLVVNGLWVGRPEGSMRVLPLRSVEPPLRDERLASLRAAIGAEVRVRP